MLHRWRNIITNWINCYFNEDNKSEENVTHESILTIISHLRENLSLDESKSSILEAHTVEEFIGEKYPEFRFDNGSLEAVSDDDLYITASLLLFFVCVNSKDVDIKNAMCSKLSSEDQEVIMKFSKGLMECRDGVTYRDVQAAITEACGQDIAAGEKMSLKVTETPPAVRSMHTEVRRLQAALDAERFDRNYLQEELARTNLKMEKLLQDKEQFKLEILNLKAKISMCCGEDSEERNADAVAETTTRLARQLEDLEERLVVTQEKLDDLQFERDTYKAKVEELKHERDKWLTISQEESTRAGQLAEELESERRNVQSLRDLIAELQQHNQKNHGLDASQLECDDPDSSISLNVSVCSEACANVIEVQLGEERAKIVALKQQMQSLQEQLTDLSQKTEHEKRILESQISEKNNEISNLKHRINEEIEAKYDLSKQHDDVVMKLNNQINELEQLFTEHKQTSAATINQNLQEIQTLQEEKLSLIQSLSNETLKLENRIQDLQSELDTQKNLGAKMKDDYEHQLMKMNEKVLNRNNELVELQNNVCSKSEMIEKLQLDIKNEKIISDTYSSELNHLQEEKAIIEAQLQKKTAEAKELQRRLVQNVEVFAELNRDIDELKEANLELYESNRSLEETKASLIAELESRDNYNEEVRKEIEKITNIFKEEKDRLMRNIDERNSVISSLQVQAQNEKQYKISLESEIQTLHQAKSVLSEEVSKLKAELANLNIEFQEKERMSYALNLYLKEERHTKLLLKAEYDELNQEYKKAIEECERNNNEIKKLKEEIETLQKKIENDNKQHEEELQKQAEEIKSLNDKLFEEVEERSALRQNLNFLNDDKNNLEKQLMDRCDEMVRLQKDHENLCKIIENNNMMIETLEKKTETETKKYFQLEKDFNTQTSSLIESLTETEKAVVEFNAQSRHTIEEKDMQIATLQLELDRGLALIQNEKENYLKLVRENEALTQKLNEEISFKNKIEEEYQNQTIMLNIIISNLNTEITTKNEEIASLNKDLKSTEKLIEERNEELQELKSKAVADIESLKQTLLERDKEIKAMKNKTNELNLIYNELELELQKETDIKAEAIQRSKQLQRENEQLHFTIEDDNSNHEVVIKEKDAMIETLEEHIKVTNMKLESIRKDYENATLAWEKSKLEMSENLEAKHNEIIKLKDHVNELVEVIEFNKIGAENVKECYTLQIDEIVKKTNENDLKRKDQIIGYVKEVGDLESDLRKAEHEINELKELLENEKMITDSLETEKARLLKENETTITDLLHEQKLYKTLQDEYAALVKEKSTLLQELLDQKSLGQIIEEEKLSLQTERDQIEQFLTSEIERKNELLGDNECLVQQLVEERSLKELLEKEQELLRAGKEALEEKIVELVATKLDLEQGRISLLQELEDEKVTKNQLQEEIGLVRQMFEEEKYAKDDIVKEKECLLNENKTIKDDMEMLIRDKEFLVHEKDYLMNENSLLKDDMEILIHDKNILMIENKNLVKSLSEEKAARDEIETEKKVLTATLQELKEQFDKDVHRKKDEIKSISAELTTLKTEFKKHEDVNVHLALLLKGGVERIVQNIKTEDISSEVLLRLLNSEKVDDITEQCNLLVNIAQALSMELTLKRSLGKIRHEMTIVESDNEMQDMISQKEIQILELQSKVKQLQQALQEQKTELGKQLESCNTLLETKMHDLQKLQLENKSLHIELSDVKVQLEVKVHSLKEKLLDNENLTEKLKKTYECQIDNMNLMLSKLTSYLKDKTNELESLRKEKHKLQQVIEGNNTVIKSLEEEVQTQKHNQEKLISDFESERLVLKNMVTVTEAVMEDNKVSLNKLISEHVKANENLMEEKKCLQEKLENEKRNFDISIQERNSAYEIVSKELSDLKAQKEFFETELNAYREHAQNEIAIVKEEIATKTSYIEKLESQNKILKEVEAQLKNNLDTVKKNWDQEVAMLHEEVRSRESSLETLQLQNKELSDRLLRVRDDMTSLEEQENELKIKRDSLESELLSQIENLISVLNSDTNKNDKFKSTLKEKLQTKAEVFDKVKVLTEEIINLVEEKNQYISKLDELKAEYETNELKSKEELEKLQQLNAELLNNIEKNKTLIADLENRIQLKQDLNQKLREEAANERLNFENKICSLLQEYQTTSQRHIADREREIFELRNKCEHSKFSKDCDHKRMMRLEEKIEQLKAKLNKYEQDLLNKDEIITHMAQEKDTVISTLNKELVEERVAKEKYQKEVESKTATLYELRQKLEEVTSEVRIRDVYRAENIEMMNVVGQRDTYAISNQEKNSTKHSAQGDKEPDRRQVSTPTSDLTHSSMDSFKTITDLEKIIHDKNRTITTLQSDITYLKSIMGESENKLLDVTKELEVSKENCQQLSSQLKKIVHQKNEEIAELKKQVSKMSVTETQSKQIIKVSAKYQAIIFRRIAEIKSNTILKELTNFGNTANCDNELKRSLNADSITMEDLENFLETTDRHLKRCSEKQVALQKERDRLSEVNRINESEIINMKKFLTELSVSFKTFSSIRELYAQKLSKVVSLQRTVRREILNLDGHITDSMMCKLERAYAAVMQDLAECAMNLERWVERSVGRTISPEKIKQAFTSETDRMSLASTSFQNTSLEVQLEELENSFQKLLEDVVKAPKGEGAKDPQAVTLMEVRAEYEDKLNRMKAKMKQLYLEQISVFKEKQKEEIAILERELQKTRDKLSESSRAYEEHIRSLTTELWKVSEKFLVQKDEADWLRRKQKSGSLMSLQNIHSSGLLPHEEVPSRPSDSLRSLPVVNKSREKKEGRGLHMSDEEGEVFDNRWLKELAETPRQKKRDNLPHGRDTLPHGMRLSELRYRNSLCPPHLKSSYPAETQFVKDTFDEEDIKCAGSSTQPTRQPRKEVGITAYKKPGPPTPSKQAGRLSATDSELRESLRVEGEPSAHVTRKTSTPSRLRALFRTSRSDTVDGTPRSKRLSIFRKK